MSAFCNNSAASERASESRNAYNEKLVILSAAKDLNRDSSPRTFGAQNDKQHTKAMNKKQLIVLWLLAAWLAFSFLYAARHVEEP
ncbi:MAG: hypothetical protein V3U28_02495, partial [Candidatus Acidoferrales bacterium]